MNWRSYIEEKWVRMAKSAIFWTEPASGTCTKEWYRYPLYRRQVVPVPLKVVPVPIDSKGLVLVPVKVVPVPVKVVPVPVKVVPVPLLPITLFLHVM